MLPGNGQISKTILADTSRAGGKRPAKAKRGQPPTLQLKPGCLSYEARNPCPKETKPLECDLRAFCVNLAQSAWAIRVSPYKTLTTFLCHASTTYAKP